MAKKSTIPQLDVAFEGARSARRQISMEKSEEFIAPNDHGERGRANGNISITTETRRSTGLVRRRGGQGGYEVPRSEVGIRCLHDLNFSSADGELRAGAVCGRRGFGVFYEGCKRETEDEDGTNTTHQMQEYILQPGSRAMSAGAGARARISSPLLESAMGAAEMESVTANKYPIRVGFAGHLGRPHTERQDEGEKEGALHGERKGSREGAVDGEFFALGEDNTERRGSSEL
ncbi:hypothetical protein FB451DRAFT_1163733 [Mycena latifolia]|nr:hypothetical protein FB451DRAFT_1163733 [Mycena latifolia]